jgi:hypothetical protein
MGTKIQKIPQPNPSAPLPRLVAKVLSTLPLRSCVSIKVLTMVGGGVRLLGGDFVSVSGFCHLPA